MSQYTVSHKSFVNYFRFFLTFANLFYIQILSFAIMTRRFQMFYFIQEILALFVVVDYCCIYEHIMKNTDNKG